MADLLPDGGFELEYWTLGADSGYDTDDPLTGLQSLGLPYAGLGPANSGLSLVFDVVAGDAVTIQFWVWADNITDESTHLELYHYPDGEFGAPVRVWHQQGPDFAAAQEWERFTVSVTPNATDDRLQFFILQDVEFDTGNSFKVDRVGYFQGTSGVAVKLAERAVGAVVSLLQTNLGTELTAIDTDRADAITMADPANAQYYKRPKPEVAGATAHIEVFEGEFTFDPGDTGTRTTTGTAFGDARALYNIPITVRVTWFNRDADTRDTMVTRGRRYSAGVFNVLAKNSDLDDSDTATKGITILSVTPAWAELDDSLPGKFKGRITIETSVRCEEIQT